MIRTALATAAASALVFHLGGCQKGPASPPTELATQAATDGAPPAPTPGAEPAPSPPPTTASLTERDPDKVLKAFAAAIEARNWQALRGFWGDHGQASGLAPAAFAAKWGALKAPVVTIGSGDQEGAAGSLYYTAPVTIADGARVIKGAVTLRRVNDVDGATPEQLRWHVESTTLEP